jgi:hypothetical protein
MRKVKRWEVKGFEVIQYRKGAEQCIHGVRKILAKVY